MMHRQDAAAADVDLEYDASNEDGCTEQEEEEDSGSEQDDVGAVPQWYSDHDFWLQGGYAVHALRARYDAVDSAVPQRETDGDLDEVCRGANRRFARLRMWCSRGMWDAAQPGDAQAVRTQLETQDPTAVCMSLFTVATIAARNDHSAALDVLLAHHADQGIDPRFDNFRDVEGAEMLCTASLYGSLTCMALLLEKGANINGRVCGQSPVHAAIFSGHTCALQLLLSAKARVDVGSECDFGRTCVSLAVTRGDEDILRILAAAKADLLEQHVSLTAPPRSLVGAIHVACRAGHTGVVEFLVQHKACVDSAGNTGVLSPLALAVKSGYVGTVDVLLRSKARVDAEADEDAYNGCRARRGRSPVCLAVYGGSLDMLRRLARAKADTNRPAIGALTPLHLAILHGHIGMVEFLLRCKADPCTVSGHEGRTPVYLAAVQNFPSALDVLVRYGADVHTARTDCGATPIFAAVYSNVPKSVEALLRLKASAAAVVVSRPLVAGAVQAVHQPLALVAARLNNHAVMRVLLRAKADVNTPGGRNNCTPAHAAATRGHAAVLRYLVEHKADVRAGTQESLETCAAAAVRHKRHRALAVLLDAHVRPDEVLDEATGATLVTLAASCNNLLALGALVKYGADVQAFTETCVLPPGCDPHGTCAAFLRGARTRALLAGASSFSSQPSSSLSSSCAPVAPGQGAPVASVQGAPVVPGQGAPRKRAAVEST